MEPQQAELASSLLRRFRDRGDPEALTRLFELVSGELFALAAHLAGDVGQAEDLVQETFLTAIAKARRWNPAKPVLPWLVGILVRVARKERRRARRRPDAERLRASVPPEGGRQALEGELRVAVEVALAELPARYAAVLRPHLDGRPPREIADELGRAPGTVRVQLHRGLERLRRLLPPGLALGTGLAGTRGIDAVRAQVRAAAEARGAILAAAGSGSLLLSSVPFLGATAVSLKSVTTVAVAAACGLGAFAWMNRDRPEPLVLAAATPATSESVSALAGVEDSVREVVETNAASRATVVEAIAVDAPRAAPKRRLLVGEVYGLTAAPPEGVELTVRVGNAGTGTIRLAGNGPFEVDLDEITSEPIALVQGILVSAQGEGVLPNAVWATPDAEETRASGARYTADLELRLLARRLVGRVVDPEGAPVAFAWIAFRDEADGEGAPIPPFHSFPQTFAEPDGSFRLELDTVDAGTLFVSGGNLRPRHLALEAGGPLEQDLGDVELDRGASIVGRAFWNGRPAPQGSTVQATAPRGVETWGHASRGLLLVEGKTAHRRALARCDGEGDFELIGLEPGLAYALAVVPAEIDGIEYEYHPVGAPGAECVAPAQGVIVDGGLVDVTLVVTGNALVSGEGMQEPVAGAEARQQLEDDDPLRPFPVLFHTPSSFRRKSGEDGLLHVLLAAGHDATVLVTAPGFLDARVTFAADELVSGAELAVELTRSGEPAKLTVELDYRGPGTLEGCLALLVMHAPDKGVQHTDPVPVADGRATFDSLPSGAFLALLYVHVPQTVPLADVPLVAGGQLSLGHLACGPGMHLEQRMVLPVGGRLELFLIGRDPALPAPEFELLEPSGNVVRPPVHAADDRGHDVADEIRTDGPIHLGRALTPGTWILRQSGPAYAESPMEVEIVEGRTTTLTFALERR